LDDGLVRECQDAHTDDPAKVGDVVTSYLSGIERSAQALGFFRTGQAKAEAMMPVHPSN
jgi:hypothetical protein